MFTLINLPYSLDALEPVISARTLEFHHGKHLRAYVDNLNKLVAGTDLEDKSLEEIIVATTPHSDPSSPSLPAPTGNLIFNNAGQILNHNLYFTQFAPSCPAPASSSCPAPAFSSCPAPTGHLKARIEARFGSFEAFQSAFVAAGVGLFGSGWVWLQADASGALSIGQYPNADNPVAHGLRPLLTFDVWEHAYYLDYQNRRAAHLEALWGIVNWGVIEERYTNR